MGDPGGIGPEVVVKALADDTLRRRAWYCVLGPAWALEAAAAAAGLPPFWTTLPPGVEADASGDRAEVVVLDDGSPPSAGEPRPTAAGGQASFRAVEQAIAMALLPARDPRHVDAIVTGPISKQAWSLAGHGQYPGHTELLAARCRATRVGMMFVSPRLRVMLATGHVPLSRVPGLLTIERVYETIVLAYKGCRWLQIERPRLAVCGLNPHAGEAGLLGEDESRVIGPAIAQACQAGIEARGPFPPDTIYAAAVRGEWDAVVAMYHDQGLIPVKLLAQDEAVNLTIGLPIVRTSPDHGTAYDIAGRGVARAGSMKAAVALAVHLAGRPVPLL